MQSLAITSRSKSQVSRMAADLDAQVEAFRTRSLSELGPFTFVAADALTMKVREAGRVINAVVLVATRERLLRGTRGRRQEEGGAASPSGGEVRHPRFVMASGGADGEKRPWTESGLVPPRASEVSVMKADPSRDREEDRVEDVVEPGTSAEPRATGHTADEAVMPAKQIHRWKDDGGALPMED